MAAQFIFTMQDVRKVHPPNKEVLKGLWLSFYPGAKIGVLGANGAGKSSLLKIMAGLDDGYSGEARLNPAFTVGYLAQDHREGDQHPVETNFPADHVTGDARGNGSGRIRI